MLTASSLLLLQAASTPAEGPAELVVQGRVFTAALEDTWAEAVAVRGQTIVAVGSRAEIAGFVGAETRVIDAGEGSVVPGFNDAHCHFSVGFGLPDGVELEGASTLDEILSRVRTYAASHPRDEVIDGHGWDLSDMPGERFPTAAMLDQVVEDRPVLLWSEGPHAVWVNSAALERAKIDGATPVPRATVFLRDEDGEPTGVFLGRGLFGLFSFVPFPELEPMKARIRAGLAEAARLGVTSVQESVSPLLLPFLAELHDRGELTLRFHVWGTLTAGPFGGGPQETLELAQEHARADWVTFGTLKGGVDGMPGLRTAALLAPYADDASTSGLATVPPERLADAVAAAHEAGLRVALHATGDAGVRAALEALAAHPAQGLRDRIEHAFLVAPADVERLARSGIVVSVQPAFLARDLALGNLYEKRFGPGRAGSVMPFRALLDAGVTLACGTDFSLTPLDPRLGLHAALTRQTLAGEPPEGFVSAQRITLAEALRAYTHGSAVAEGAEARKGTLEPGKLADLAVFSRDLFALSPAGLREAEVVATIVGGRIAAMR